MEIIKQTIKSINKTFRSRLALKVAMPVLIAISLFSLPVALRMRESAVIESTNTEIHQRENARDEVNSMARALMLEQIAIDKFVISSHLSVGQVSEARAEFESANAEVVRWHDEAFAHADSASEIEALQECERLHQGVADLFYTQIMPEASNGIDGSRTALITANLDTSFQKMSDIGRQVSESFTMKENVAASNQVMAQQTASEMTSAASIAAVLVGLGLAFFTARRLVSPIKSMAEAARNISRGDMSQRVDIKGWDEISDLGRSFNYMADSLQSHTLLLQKEKTRIKSIHQSIGDGIIVIGQGGTVLSVNPAAEAALGRTSIELEGSTDIGVPVLQRLIEEKRPDVQQMVKCWEVKDCDKSDCPSYGSPNRRCWLTCGTFCYNQIQGTFKQKRDACERCSVFKSNAVRERDLGIGSSHFSVLVVPILDDFGQEEGLTLVMHDITQIQQAKADLEHHSAELEAINRISDTLSASLDLKTVMNATLEQAGGSGGTDAAVIHLLDHDTDRLMLSAYSGITVQSLVGAEIIPRGSGCPGHALEAGETVIEGDLSKAAGIPVDVLAAGFRSALSAPIRSKNKTIGTLTQLSRRNDAYSEADARLMTLIGNQVGIAVDNATMYAESVERTRRELAHSRIAAALTTGLDLNDVFEKFVRETGRLVDFDRITVAIPEDGDALKVIAAWGEGRGAYQVGSILPLKGSAPEWALNNRAAYFATDIAGEMKFTDQRQLHEAGSNSQLNMPLMVKDKVLGTLNFSSHKRNAFNQDDVDELGPVAHQLALALSSQQLFADVARAKTEWETTFDSVSEGIAIVNAEHRVVRLNKAAATMMGSDHIDELVGRKCFEVIHGVCEQPSVCPMTDAVLGSEPTRSEQATVDGRTLELTVDPIFDDQGRKQGAVHFLRDITEAAKMRQQLLQSEKMVAVGQLVAGVAHEINNPLTGVIGYSQLLLSRQLDEKTKRDVEQIYHEAERATKIVRHLLSFARKHQPERKLVNLNQVIQESLELKAYDLKVNNIEVVEELDAALPLTAVDPHQLQQVFLKLITNAEQEMVAANGGGLLKVSTLGQGQTIRLSFSDNGPGIAEEIRERIFDPFFTTKDVGQGTGLGLSVCFGVIEEHEGTIGVDSSYSGGAGIVIELPVTSQEPSMIDATISGNHPGEQERVGKILLVDDESSIRNMLRETLKRVGHDVDTARDGQVALRMLEQKHYDCIVSDVKMPGIDGTTLHRMIKDTDPVLAGTFIFVSGDTVSPETRSYLAESGNPYLAKPFSLDALQVELQKMLSSGRD
ncbi:MAG: GAF domain-containing protein [Thermoleophilia bacterium]